MRVVGKVIVKVALKLANISKLHTRVAKSLTVMGILYFKDLFFVVFCLGSYDSTLNVWFKHLWLLLSSNQPSPLAPSRKIRAFFSEERKKITFEMHSQPLCKIILCPFRGTQHYVSYLVIWSSSTSNKRWILSLAAWTHFSWMHKKPHCYWASPLPLLQEGSATATSGGQEAGATTRGWCGVSARMVSMSQVTWFSYFGYRKRHVWIQECCTDTFCIFNVA